MPLVRAALFHSFCSFTRVQNMGTSSLTVIVSCRAFMPLNTWQFLLSHGLFVTKKLLPSLNCPAAKVRERRCSWTTFSLNCAYHFFLSGISFFFSFLLKPAGTFFFFFSLWHLPVGSSSCFGPVCRNIGIPSFENVIFYAKRSLSCSEPFVIKRLVLFRLCLVCSNLILTYLVSVRSLF